MMLSRDKVLSKQILTYHRIPTPQFAVFRRGARSAPARLRYPLFVKSATEDASLGISQASSSRMPRACASASTSSTSTRSPMRWSRNTSRGANCTSRARQRADPHTAALGVHLRRTEGRQGGIATRKASGTAPTRSATDHELRRRTCRRAWPRGSTACARNLPRAAHVGLCAHGFPRACRRHAFVLEANANPNLARTRISPTPPTHAGIDYPALLERIIALGCAYRAEWRRTRPAGRRSGRPSDRLSDSPAPAA